MTPATAQPDFIPDTAPPPTTTSGAGSSPDFIPDFIPDTSPAAAPAAPAPTPRPDEVMPTVAQSTLQAGAPGTVVEGAWKELKTLAAGLMDLANRPILPGLTTDPARNAALVPEIQALDTHLRQTSAPTTPLEKAGKFGIQALALADPAMWEGEGAAAGMSVAQRIAAIGRNAQMLEKNPGLLNMLKRLSVDTATGATQAAVPNATLAAVETGGDPQATATAGITGGLLGAGLGGAGGVVREAGQAAAAKVGQILSERAASEAAPSTFAAGATNTLQRALDRLGGNRVATPVADYGQAVKQIEQHANSIYNEADRVTDGRWRPANAAVQAAKKTGDTDAIAAAQQNLDALSTGFDDANYGQAVKETTDRARAAFHDTHALQSIHDGLVQAFDFGTPETAAARGSENVFNGNKLENQLKGLERNSEVGRDRMMQLLGEDGLNGLYDLANVAKNPAQNQRLVDVIKQIATRAHSTGSKTSWASGMLGAFLPTGWAKAASAGYAAGSAVGGVTATAENLMNYVATKPRLIRLANYAAKNNVSTSYAATLMAAAINHEMERDQATAPPPPQGQAQTQQPQRNPYMAAENPKGLLEQGNLPIWNRPTVNNADGSHSSEYSTSFEDDQGREVLVPTIVNGRFLTPDGKKPAEGSPAEKAMFRRAAQHYRDTGEHLGKFDNADNADTYANVLHSRPQGVQ